jgi:hypothetical protein
MADTQSPALPPPAANGAENAAAETTPGASDPTQVEKPKPKKPRSRRGYVARLPKAVRDRVNHLLDDGFTYRGVIRQLGDDGQGLTPDHIRRWKEGGYQDYLREQRLIDQCRARTDHALNLLSQGHIQGFQATQQLATSQICEALAGAGSDVLREALAGNPMNYFRMLNAFARLTNGGLKCERLLDEQTQIAARAQPPPGSAPKKGLTPGTLKEMNDKLHLL